MMESTFFQDVMAEGEVVRARKDVLQVLQLRFGDAAVREFTPALEKVIHLEQLEVLHKLAVTSRRVSQFRKALVGL